MITKEDILLIAQKDFNSLLKHYPDSNGAEKRLNNFVDEIYNLVEKELKDNSISKSRAKKSTVSREQNFTTGNDESDLN